MAGAWEFLQDYAHRHTFGPKGSLGEVAGVRRDETDLYVFLRGSEHLVTQLANWGKQSFSGLYADAWERAAQMANLTDRPLLFRAPNPEEKAQIGLDEQIRAKRAELEELEARR